MRRKSVSGKRDVYRWGTLPNIRSVIDTANQLSLTEAELYFKKVKGEIRPAAKKLAEANTHLFTWIASQQENEWITYTVAFEHLIRDLDYTQPRAESTLESMSLYRVKLSRRPYHHSHTNSDSDGSIHQRERVREDRKKEFTFGSAIVDRKILENMSRPRPPASDPGIPVHYRDLESLYLFAIIYAHTERETRGGEPSSRENSQTAYRAGATVRTKALRANKQDRARDKRLKKAEQIKQDLGFFRSAELLLQLMDLPTTLSGKWDVMDGRLNYMEPRAGYKANQFIRALWNLQLISAVQGNPVNRYYHMGKQQTNHGYSQPSYLDLLKKMEAAIAAELGHRSKKRSANFT